MLNNYKLYIFLTTAFVAISSFIDVKASFEQPKWDDNLNLAEIENRLKTEKIIKLINVWGPKQEITDIENFTPKNIERNGRSMPYYAILESGLKCVAKIRNNSFAEAAAYEGSKFLGLKLVPPTVMRKINGQDASLQFFVDKNFRIRELGLMLEKADKKDLSDAEVFIFVFGQKDSGKTKNKLGRLNGNKFNLALIDNEIIGLLKKLKTINTKVFYSSTINAFNKLNLNSLRYIWRHEYSVALPERKLYLEQLFKRILMRRDYMLNIANSQNSLIL